MDIETWKTQLRKGAAELAILAALARADATGTGLVQRLAANSALGLSDGTVYPLLARLERDGRIIGRWEPEPNGARPRKLYSLTDAGRTTLGAMRTVWTDFANQLTAITGGAE
jgi:PadR family transcriptional regulator PadR